MFRLALLVLVCVSFNANAQTFSIPPFPIHGATFNEFLLPNWNLKDTATGFIDSDNVRDALLVLEYNDTVTEMRPDGYTNVGHPRVILLLLGTSNGYQTVIQDNTFLLRDGEGGMDPDPYDHPKIDSNLVEINFQFTRGDARYRFRFNHKKLELVEAESGGISQDTAEHWTFNFLKGIAVKEESAIGDEHSTRTDHKLILDHLRTLDELRQPFNWEVLPGALL